MKRFSGFIFFLIALLCVFVHASAAEEQWQLAGPTGDGYNFYITQASHSIVRSKLEPQKVQSDTFTVYYAEWDCMARQARSLYSIVFDSDGGAVTQVEEGHWQYVTPGTKEYPLYKYACG